MFLLYAILVYCSQEVNASLYSIISSNRLYNYTPPENDVTFYLYHSSDLSTGEQIFIGNNLSLHKSRFDSKLPTKFIVHGWTHGRDVPWLVEMREAMANVGLWNIIVVDWAPLSRVIYTEARVHNQVVAKQLVNFLLFLRSFKYVSMSLIHLVGHSMGAQISAMAGYKIKLRIQEKIGRITGLDPAAPLYEWPHIESLDEILDPSDATFVDVIHTNGRHLGMITPAGHVDYYPNGGEIQEGCMFWICSHLRACAFWTASIRKPNLFKAYGYNSWDDFLSGKIHNLKAVPMGIAASSNVPFGIYIVETSNEYEKYITTKTTLIDSYYPDYN